MKKHVTSMQSIEIDLKVTQMQELADKDFKADIINVFKKLKENMVIMSDQINFKFLKKNQMEL